MTENDSDELKFNSRLKLKNISNLSDSYDGVGADLKIARNRKGLKIEDVANSIRISSIYIIISPSLYICILYITCILYI